MPTLKVPLVLDATSGLIRELNSASEYVSAVVTETTVALNSSGSTINAGEAVNIYDNAGVLTFRKANATDDTKPCDGFLLADTADAATGTIQLEGTSTVQTSGSAAAQILASQSGTNFFLSTTAGKITTTPPAADGNVTQLVGFGVGVGNLRIEIDEPIVRHP